MTIDYARTTPRSQGPETILDGVNWPGLVFLMLGVATLAWTLTGPDGGTGARGIAGTTVTALALIIGFTWSAVDHARFRTHKQFA